MRKIHGAALTHCDGVLGVERKLKRALAKGQCCLVHYVSLAFATLLHIASRGIFLFFNI